MRATTKTAPALPQRLIIRIYFVLSQRDFSNCSKRRNCKERGPAALCTAPEEQEGMVGVREGRAPWRVCRYSLRRLTVPTFDKFSSSNSSGIRRLLLLRGPVIGTAANGRVVMDGLPLPLRLRACSGPAPPRRQQQQRHHRHHPPAFLPTCRRCLRWPTRPWRCNVTLWDDVLEQFSDLLIVKSSGDVVTVSCRTDVASQFGCFLHALRSLYLWLMLPWQQQQQELFKFAPDGGLRLRAALVYGPLRGAVVGTSALSFEHFGEAVTLGLQLVRNPPILGELPTLIVAQERFLQQAAVQLVPLTTKECGAVDGRELAPTLAASEVRAIVSPSPQQWHVAGRQGAVVVRTVTFDSA